MYGVWSPTTQDYLNLFANYVQQKAAHFKRKQTCVDLGCGTGVLPIVLSENGDYEGKIFSIDSLPNAIKATEINS